VRLFAVDDLSDVVVLAGPNGVGKTRLLERITQHLRNATPHPDIEGVVEATCSEERDSWGGKTNLDMSVSEDMDLLRGTLQANRRRRNWRSSLVNIESDRAIRRLESLQFSWDMADPEEEEISWDRTFGFMRDRFQDTVHSMFRMIETQKQGIANRAVDLRRRGYQRMKLDFSDPMDAFKQAFSLLLAPKELVDPSAREQRLEYRLDGEVRDFSTLSSGEHEVANIAFDFLLRKPQDCIVFFDEPDLHLHPELSYRLLQALQQIGVGNQLFLSTHSPDIISASLDRTVVFISPPSPNDNDEGDPPNQAIVVSEADETHQALKLLGQSIGIITLGKRIVLIEGALSSIDKQTYGSIIKSRWPELVLVPSGGKHVIESFAAVYDAVLSKTIWGVEFFMLCDGDSVPVGSPEQAEAAQRSGRLRVLSKYHVENYFLDEHVWASALSPMSAEGSWQRSPSTVRDVLRESARGLVSYAAALATASRLRLSVGNLDLMPKDCQRKSLLELQPLLLAEVEREKARLEQCLDQESIKSSMSEYFERLTRSLDDDSEDWKALIPGKPLLGMFATRIGLDQSKAKMLYLNAGLTSDRRPFAEIEEIFKDFAESG
jgi:energy-coupling factor transporter ATP-binding protein EcfA2